MSFVKIALSAMICAATLAITSCVVQDQPSGPRGAVAHQKYNRFSGGLTARLGCSMFQADKAVRASAKKLQLIELSRINQQQSVNYEYKTIYEDRVDVSLKPEKNGLASIYIKKGKGGDHDFAKKLMKEIASRITVDEEAVAVADYDEQEEEEEETEE